MLQTFVTTVNMNNSEGKKIVDVELVLIHVQIKAERSYERSLFSVHTLWKALEIFKISNSTWALKDLCYQ